MWVGLNATSLFHDKRHLRHGRCELEAFLSSLATQRNVSAATQNQALSALLFLYRQVLEIPVPWLDDVVRAKKPSRLPTVLTQSEIAALHDQLDDPQMSLLVRFAIRVRLAPDGGSSLAGQGCGAFAVRDRGA